MLRSDSECCQAKASLTAAQQKDMQAVAWCRRTCKIFFNPCHSHSQHYKQPQALTHIAPRLCRFWHLSVRPAHVPLIPPTPIKDLEHTRIHTCAANHRWTKQGRAPSLAMMLYQVPNLGPHCATSRLHTCIVATLSCCAVTESTVWWHGTAAGMMSAGSMPLMMSWLKVLPKLCRVLAGPAQQPLCMERSFDIASAFSGIASFPAMAAINQALLGG